MSDSVAEEYLSSLADLTVNSKPLINMLTMLADENSAHAPAIVEAIERHIDKVSPDVKLPILYLIDSIIKNVSAVYKPLFTENIVRIFASVFEKVDEKTRMSMFKLRQTWTDIFPAKKLYALDCRIHYIDQHWPNITPPPTGSNLHPSIHLNPKFLPISDKNTIPAVVKAAAATPEELQATMEKKQKILLELQQKKRELELLQQHILFREQMPRNAKQDDSNKVVRNISGAKSLPRAVVIPPANAGQSSGAPSNRAKIAPVNSALLEAVKSRDPRLNRGLRKQENPASSPPKAKKSPRKVPEPEINLVEDLIRQQNSQSSASQQFTRFTDVKTPEAKVQEEMITKRQLAMLKAPVLGQLNRKGTDDKSKRRNSPPRNKDSRNHRDSPKSGDKSKQKDDKSRKKTFRDKGSRYSFKSEENRHDRRRDKRDNKVDRKPERKVEPAFSPASSDCDSPPRSRKRSSPLPQPPPPPVIGSSNTTEEAMDIEILSPVTIKPIPERESVTFKSVKNTLKARNYSRRNKERSVSPLDSPPRPAEKLSRKPADIVDVGKDTDLRHVLRSPKKRPSVDGIEELLPSKQMKPETVDVISDLFGFGSQDKDYRMGMCTPPPPVISLTPPSNSPKPDEPKDIEKPRMDFNRRSPPVGEDLPVDEILAQAQDQLTRGSVTLNQYNDIVAQVVRKNEGQKIKNAQQSFDGPRGKYSDQRPWRRDEENAPFDRRWRNGRSGRGGGKGRGRGSNWRENRPDFTDHDTRSQEAWLPNMGPQFGATIIPATDLAVLEVIDKDPAQHISIDGTPRAIRYYGDVAVVTLSLSSVRQIHFENGMRRVFIGSFDVLCKLNGPAVPFIFQNITYMIRLGAPTRELYIDDRFYELHFGDQRLTVEFGGVPLTVQLEGPPPEVRFDPRGARFCLGCVVLIVDARRSFDIYLDAKPQKFEINGRPLVLRFTDKFNIILINEVPVALQFGGNPVPINFCEEQHFLRLTELPPEVVPGKACVYGMNPIEDNVMFQENNSNELPAIDVVKSETDRGIYMNLLSSTMGTTETDKNDQMLYNYQLCSENSNPPVKQQAPAAAIPMLQNLDINNLFETLVASGIISKQEQADSTASVDTMPVDFRDPKSLKEANPGAVMLLYSGMQCASCGVRFPTKETAKYSQHLDWHFRQNRRDRDAARRGASRRWYYDIPDWMQYEEVEDLEERALNWFETEGQNDEPVEHGEIPSVPAPPHKEIVHCFVCHDQFDSFFHEDTEEWHLKNCVAFGDNFYHPVCYEDSLKRPENLSVPPLLAPLEIEKPPKVEETVVVLDIEDDDKEDDEDLDDVEVVTNDFEAIENLVESLINRVEMEEECERSPIEDDELEVLAVTNKDENKPPVEVIEVFDDGEVFGPPSPVVFDPDITIKQEPIEEMEAPLAQVDQTTTNITACIDGNVEMAEPPTAPAAIASKIRITFSKSQPVVPEPTLKPLIDTVVDPNELQIEEIEPEPLPLKPKKPRIAERELTVYPTVAKGKEVSGLCSIM